VLLRGGSTGDLKRPGFFLEQEQDFIV
jgi:hypothetical protein